MRSIAVILFATLLMGAAPAPARDGPGAQGAVAAVEAFHTALHRGDERGAAALLSDDALIFESGGVERNKAEYEARHLPADAEFSQAVSSTVTRRTARSDGSIAWVASEGRTAGTWKGRQLDLVTTETMVLRRVGRAWKIMHIHWSSSKRD